MKTQKKMALTKALTRKVAIRTPMMRMAARMPRIKTQTTRMMTMTQMQLEKRKRKVK